MRPQATSGVSIAAVSRQTGIPVTTLRFYEKELAGLFHIRKTRGGHRRYRPQDVARFAAVRRLTESEGVKLAEVRGILASRGDSEPIREDMDDLRKSAREQSQRMEEFATRMARLEERLGKLEAARPGRRWFRS